MAIDIVSANDADLAAFGGSGTTISKWTYNAASAPTDAQAVAGVQANARTACIKNGATASDKAAIALAILESVQGGDLSLLNTVGKRKFFRLRRGLNDWIKFLDQVQA